MTGTSSDDFSFFMSFVVLCIWRNGSGGGGMWIRFVCFGDICNNYAAAQNCVGEVCM